MGLMRRPEARNGSTAPAIAEADAPAVDRGVLEGIRGLANESAPDLLHQVIRLYLDSAPELLDKLRAGLDACDKDAVRAAAHTLKSSSANLGATALANLCRQLEVAARAGDFSSDLPSITAVEFEYTRVRAALENELGTTV